MQTFHRRCKPESGICTKAAGCHFLLEEFSFGYQFMALYNSLCEVRAPLLRRRYLVAALLPSVGTVRKKLASSALAFVSLSLSDRKYVISNICLSGAYLYCSLIAFICSRVCFGLFINNPQVRNRDVPLYCRWG